MKRPPLGRLIALLSALILAIGVVTVRLAVLQVSQAATFQDRGLDQRLRTVALPATRGQILDRTGENPLAISLRARDVYADPRYIDDPLRIALQVAPILGLDVMELARGLAGDGSFVWVARQIDRDLAARVERLNLPGIGFLSVSKRYYPAGPLASQVLGFVGIDGEGLAGLEFGYQSRLAGTPGERTVEIDPSGQPIAGGIHVERPPVPGDDVMTTIDRDLQYQVQTALEEAVKVSRAKGGNVIVMDPDTGEILAMADYPWFDPNRFAESSEETWRSRAVTDAFEPGSVNKVITAAAAIEERVLPLDERLPIPDRVRVGDFVIHDSHPHPVERMTLGDIIAQSSNVGAIRVAELLGRDHLAQYLMRFGFGHTTGLGFPGESAGLLRPLYDWTDTSLATIAFGQGISVTPLQMASVYATIANGGEWVQPRLVRGTIDPLGEFHPADVLPSRRVVSGETARTVAEMLARAVEDGTGTAAQIPGYQVAGKTGTARKPYEDRSGYSNRYVASFIGFLPASAPRVVIAVMLDEPRTSIYGGVVAAPVFQRIARYAIRSLGIPPGDPLPLPPARPVP